MFRLVVLDVEGVVWLVVGMFLDGREYVVLGV